MKVTVESITPVKKKLSVSIPEDQVLEEFDEAYRTLGKQVRIPGFRPGKAPRTLLEKQFGREIESEVFQSLVQKSFVQALKDHSLDAVAVPEIKEPKRQKGEGFTYTASIEVKPQFEPKDYQGVKLKRENAGVTEDQIKGVIAKLQDSQAVLKDRERATKPLNGDFVVVTLQGIDSEGKSLTQDEPKEQLYEIGGEILHPDLGKELIKMSIGEIANVDINVKAQKKEGVAEPRKLRFRVILKGIKEKILPSVDDEFAKSVGAFENVAALRERITKDLQEELEEKSKSELTQNLMAHLVKQNPVELPESLVEEECHALIHGFWNELKRAGMKDIPEEYSEKKLHDKFHPDAERRVHEQMLIEAVAKKENIAVDDNEVTQQIQKLATASKVPAHEMKAYLDKTGRLSGMRFTLLAQKTVDFLLSQATIK